MQQDASTKTAASLDELDLRSSHFPKIPKIASDKDSAMSEGGVSERRKFAREKNSFAVGHADKVRPHLLYFVLSSFLIGWFML